MRRAIDLKIIHRNRLLRECLVSVLSDIEGFQVTDADHTDLDCLKSIEEERPDVVLIDLNLPEELAVELTQLVRQRVDGAKVIVLAYATAQENLVECVAAGAHGCVLEESSLQDLQVAIEKVIGGETFCSPGIVQSIFRRLAQSARPFHSRERVKSVDLTPRELEVVHLIADGLSNKQIARRLSLSLYTVKNHVHNIVEKLQVENRFEAVEYARQRRWLKKLGVVGPSSSS